MTSFFKIEMNSFSMPNHSFMGLWLEILGTSCNIFLLLRHQLEENPQKNKNDAFVSISMSSSLYCYGNLFPSQVLKNCSVYMCVYTVNVVCFQFSPFAKGSKRYMLSTGTDATVCFWQWDVNNINFRWVLFIKWHFVVLTFSFTNILS